MRVLIIEPDLTGHHAPYLRHMLRATAELNQDAVVLACAGASQSKQFALHLHDVAASVTWDESMAPVCGSLRHTARMFAELLQAVDRYHADQVWVPYADFVTAYLGARALIGCKAKWPANVEIEGLFFRAMFAYPAPQWRKHFRRTLSRLFLRTANWDILHLLDPLPFDMMRKQYAAQSNHLRLMPDPVENVSQVNKDDARARLGIPTSGRYLGCMGVLYNRPGIGLLLQAFRRAKLGAEDRLLLAGPMNDAVRNMVDSEYRDLIESDRIVTIDRHMNLDEVMLAVMASDVVSVPIPFRMGSSSFTIRAAAAGRPVLTDDFGWMGWAVRRFDLGWCVDIWNVSAFADALQVAVENADKKTTSPAAERFVRYHSAENFKAHWTARLRERLGLPPDPNLVSWQWVLDEPPVASA